MLLFIFNMFHSKEKASASLSGFKCHKTHRSCKTEPPPPPRPVPGNLEREEKLSQDGGC